MQASLLSISKPTVINGIIRRTSHFDQGLKQNTEMANVSLWMSLLVLIILYTLCSEGSRYMLSCCDRALKLKTMPHGLLFIISLYVVQIRQDMASVSLETCLPCSILA